MVYVVDFFQRNFSSHSRTSSPDGQDNQHTTSGDKENPVTGDIAYPIVAMVLLLGAATAVTLTRRK